MAVIYEPILNDSDEEDEFLFRVARRLEIESAIRAKSQNLDFNLEKLNVCLEKLNDLKNQEQYLLDQVLEELRKEYKYLTQCKSFTAKINVEIEKEFVFCWDSTYDGDWCIDICQADLHIAQQLIQQKSEDQLSNLHNKEEIVQFDLQVKEFVKKCNAYAKAFGIDENSFHDKIGEV